MELEPLSSAEAAPLRSAPPAIVGGEQSFATVTDKISSFVLSTSTARVWFLGFTIGFGLLCLLLLSIGWLFIKGIGIWGVNVPVGWGFDIINFVWWIGIGHAGTLISAILLLLRQSWRRSINRFAEAMTIFAVACAGMYPLLHMGRPWFGYWLFPYPNIMGLWPNFRSPLVWDVFAVSTYATVSMLFWYVGMIPDLATLRDRAKNQFARITYGFLSLGWRGAATHWHRYETACLLLAGLSTPLVLSVHTVVSFDFTIGIIPGWHATIFPPYFVAGAIYAGFAMVLLISIPLRAVCKLEDFITQKHLTNMASIMLATGLIVCFGYLMEAFFAYYSGNFYERFMLSNRMFGQYGWAYWSLLFCNFLTPQVLWFKKFRTSPAWLFLVSVIVSVGMWLERFVIIVTSLANDFLPSSWGRYVPTRWDFATYLGTIGLFVSLLFLFLRFLPMMSMYEMRAILPSAKLNGSKQAHGGGHGS